MAALPPIHDTRRFTMRSKIQPKKVSPVKAAATKRTTGATKAAAKKASPKKAATPAAPTKQRSLLEAAYIALQRFAAPMTTQQIIEAVTDQKLWTSPGGKTPDRTLYSALVREIAAKGADARFQKVEKGKFALAAK
ncbi:winged helix-turn-helix domain-containing protein [Botrimarina hoheduenensis]|uniref:winged helix-turn-helix domain-containing protein n=1 Tax=Botrimarina hoheduenensis TaxID=2528000 RepID=UPI0011B7B184